MNRSDPPRIASWLLEHLIFGNRNEALAGDLQESYRAGRSNGWYWRQVLSAIIIGVGESLLRHPAALFFAVLWSMVSPAWQLTILRFRHHSDFAGFIWMLPWPLSTICDLGLSAAEALVFIWAPLLCFIFLRRFIKGGIDSRAFVRAVWSSALACFGAVICQIAIAMFMSSHARTKPIDWRTLSISGVVFNVEAWDLVLRLPYFFGTLCALWGLESHAERSMKPAR